MKTRSFYPVLLALLASGSVLCQNTEELPIPVEADNQFPPERSESDSNSEGTESTAEEPTQPTLEPTTIDVAISALAEENEHVIDAADEITAVEPLQTTLRSTITDSVAESSEPTSGSTIVDLTESAMTNDDEQDTKIEDSETTPLEPTQTTPESTIIEESVPELTNDEQDTKIEDSETTPLEPTQTTPESTIVEESVPELTNDEQDTKIEDSETTLLEPTQTTPESTIVEESVAELTNDDEQVTKNEDIETTAVEPTQTTTGSTIADITAPISTTNEEQDTTYKDSETTTAESIHIMSGSTISNTDQNQVTNNETMVVEPTESTPESPMDTGSTCPEPCICITDGDASNYIVDCSGHGLTDLPEPIDPKTTSLKLQNNQLIVIPKRISELKNLKNLNANDNLITELESGSVSELKELVSLKLANNRFQEYPKDLENALNLDKLEELDLAGNELKTTPDIFLNLKALRTVTLLEVSSELVSQLCSLKETIEKVCTESCSEHSFECKDVSAHDKENSLDATLPGMIPFFHEIVKEDTKNSEGILASSEISNTPKTYVNPETTTSSKAKETLDSKPLSEIPSTPGAKEISDTSADLSVPDISANSRRKESSKMSPNAPEMPSSTNNNLPVNEFSLRTAVNNAPQEKVALQSIVIDNTKEFPNNETDVKVGAKTTETKGGGGVDKSMIAVIVAGMVVIVAVIAIKKNWSSIRKRFSSTPRANDRSDRNTNGTAVTPEEVPLQDKSPV